jgi:hypothetical protein
MSFAPSSSPKLRDPFMAEWSGVMFEHDLQPHLRLICFGISSALSRGVEALKSGVSIQGISDRLSGNREE